MQPAGRSRAFELYLRHQSAGRDFTVSLHPARGDLTPATTVLDTVTVSSDTTTSSFAWYTFDLSAAALAPSDGLCLTITASTNPGPVHVRYTSGGIELANSAMSIGNPGWGAPATDRALHYRINGTYTGGSPLAVVAGTWRRETN